MTIYEQIQRALDQMETSLSGPVEKEEICRHAGMSVRSFQHYFWAVTGLTYKEYLVRRRLTEAAERLGSTDATVLQVALECGYQTHESFTRAFRKQFGVSPREFRLAPVLGGRLGRLRTYRDLARGVVLKDIPALVAVAFEGFQPDPEGRAHDQLLRWQRAHRPPGPPGRVFGHNLTATGTTAFGPEHDGYRLWLTLPSAPPGTQTTTLAPGRFAVTGIEGSFAADPEGAWVTAGWNRMTAMVREKGYRVLAGGRWFEEHLEPQTPGNLRLDLYLELEGETQ